MYEVFFTGKDDPRDGCIVIGEDTKPIFYRFDTPPSHVGNPRTTVSAIRPLLRQPLSIPLAHTDLPECWRDRRLHGLDICWLSARSPHDRQPSITHDPVCDAWIDGQVRRFRLFGPHLPPPLPHTPISVRGLDPHSPSSFSHPRLIHRSSTARESSSLPTVVSLNGEDVPTIPVHTMQVSFPLTLSLPSLSHPHPQTALHRSRKPANRNIPTLPSRHPDRPLVRIHVLPVR